MLTQTNKLRLGKIKWKVNDNMQAWHKSQTETKVGNGYGEKKKRN